MNKTAKYISARQLGRNAIITLGLGNKKKKRITKERDLRRKKHYFIMRPFLGQELLLTLTNPLLLT